MVRTMVKPKAVDPRNGPVAVRMRKLVKQLHLTQDAVADRAKELGSSINRNDVNKVCTGKNQATTEKIRRGLALGTGINQLDLNAYLDGELTLEDLQRRRLRFVANDATGEVQYGQLEGWDELEQEAKSNAYAAGMSLTPLDFAGARLKPAKDIPPKLTPRFITTIAWLWSETATEEMRQEARKYLGAPPSRPPNSRASGSGDR